MGKKSINSNVQQNGTASTSRGLQTTHVVLILGTIMIISVAVVAAIVLTRPKETPTPVIAPISGAAVINESNMAEIMDDVNKKVEAGMFQTHMNTTWRFPDGKSASSNAVMGNSAANNYPMWFEVKLKDSGEVVYTSSLLPLGSQVKEVILNRELAKGTYPAIISIHMIDENEDPVESNMGFSISLVIQN